MFVNYVLLVSSILVRQTGDSVVNLTKEADWTIAHAVMSGSEGHRDCDRLARVL